LSAWGYEGTPEVDAHPLSANWGDQGTVVTVPEFLREEGMESIGRIRSKNNE
jgi:hypothetical protein